MFDSDIKTISLAFDILYSLKKKKRKKRHTTVNKICRIVSTYKLSLLCIYLHNDSTMKNKDKKSHMFVSYSILNRNQIKIMHVSSCFTSNGSKIKHFTIHLIISLSEIFNTFNWIDKSKEVR